MFLVGADVFKIGTADIRNLSNEVVSTVAPDGTSGSVTLLEDEGLSDILEILGRVVTLLIEAEDDPD